MLDVVSAVPGVIWPAIPNLRGLQLLAVQFQLEQSQWLSPDELRQRQAGQLFALCQHAYSTVPHYRRRFDEVGLSPAGVQEPEAWRRLPLLTRSDIQNAGEQLHSAEKVDEHGPRTTTATSGSSGQPVTTSGTAVTALFTAAILLRYHLWNRRDLSLKLAAIRSLKQADMARETTSENWGGGTMDIVRTGPSVALDVHATAEEQADFLVRNDPDYLNTYPSIVLMLCDHFARSGQKLTRLREVRTFGEVLEPQVRAACRRVWGVPISDTYSAQEVGQIALQCPENEDYHVQAESMLVEVLDDRGRACHPGEIGRVVLTSLHNFAMPLIRYDIGDFAEVGGPCSCGRGLPVLKKIIGRQRNMIVLPNGRRVWPAIDISAPEQATQLPPIQQFQLIQRTVTNLELLLVTPRALSAPEEQMVRGMVDRGIGSKLDLKITYVSVIPRGTTGKYEDVRCEVDLPP